MDEIWGEENFVTIIAWQKVFAKKNKALVSGSHDHILVYAKNLEQWSRNLLPRDDEQTAAFQNPDNDPRGPWQSVSFSVQSEDSERRKSYRYEITLPSGRTIGPPPGRHWNGLSARYKELLSDNRIWFGQNGDNPPRVKTFLSEVQEGIVPDTWWRHEDTGNNQEAKKEIIDLFGESEPFNTPKPTRLIRKMIQIATDKDSIILDFFAGSGTTAHAVMAENLADSGHRRYLLMQLPEPTGRSDFPTISGITRERIRLASKSMESQLGSTAVDLGFRSYSLAASNFGVWDSEPEGLEELASQLQLAVQNIRPGSDEAAILTELMLKAGYPLTASVEVLSLGGINVYSVSEGALLVCLADTLTINLFEAMAEQQPAMILVLDASFKGNDELKVNALQTIRTANQRVGSDIVLRVV